MSPESSDAPLIVTGKRLHSKLPRGTYLKSAWTWGLAIYVVSELVLITMQAAGVNIANSQRWHFVLLFGIGTCCVGFGQQWLFQRYVCAIPPHCLIVLSEYLRTGRNELNFAALFLLFWFTMTAHMLLLPGINVFVLMALAGGLGVLVHGFTLFDAKRGSVQRHYFWLFFGMSNEYAKFEFSAVRIKRTVDDDDIERFHIILAASTGEIDRYLEILSFAEESEAVANGERIASYFDLPFQNVCPKLSK